MGSLEFFIDLIPFLRPHSDPWVDSVSNRYKHQGYLLCLTLNLLAPTTVGARINP